MNNDTCITSDPVKLNINPKEIEALRSALIPQVLFDIPKGYYSVGQLSETLKISRSNIIRRLKKMLSENKADKIIGYSTRSNGKKTQIPYYKIKT